MKFLVYGSQKWGVGGLLKNYFEAISMHHGGVGKSKPLHLYSVVHLQLVFSYCDL